MSQPPKSLPLFCNVDVDISPCPLFLKPSVYRDGDLLLDGFFPLYSWKSQLDLQQLYWLSKPIQTSPECFQNVLLEKLVVYTTVVTLPKLSNSMQHDGEHWHCSSPSDKWSDNWVCENTSEADILESSTTVFCYIHESSLAVGGVVYCTEEYIACGKVVFNITFVIPTLAYIQDIVGFIFSFLHGSNVVWELHNYHYILAFLFAIEEINKDPRLLPNFTLGFNLYNAFNKNGKPLENIFFWFSGGNQTVPNYSCQKQSKSAAIIAGTTPEFSSNISPLLELYKIPQVTYGPYDSLLSDKDQFPSLYQMAAKDNFLTHGLVLLFLHFDWTWVGIIVSDDVKSYKFASMLEAEMLKKYICTVFMLTLPISWIWNDNLDVENIPRLADHEKVNVSVLHGDSQIIMGVYFYGRTFELVGKMWVIATELYIDLHRVKHIMDFFHGSLSFLPQKREVPGFEDFIKTFNPSKYPEDFYLEKLWLDTFECSFSGSLCRKFKDCLPNISLEFIPGNTIMSESTYIVYNAVHIVTRALHEMFQEETETGLKRDANIPMLLSWQLHLLLRNIQFTNSIGEHISLEDQRKLVKRYDILNTVSFPAAHDFLVKVGEFVINGQNNQTLVLNKEAIEWPIELEKPPISVCTQKCGPGFKKVIQAKAICCFECVFCLTGEISNTQDAQDCIQCSDQEYSNQERTHCLPKLVTYLSIEDSLGMALAFTALCVSVITVVVLWIFVKHQDTPIVKANNRTLSYILLISLLLCFLCSFLFIGRPHPVTCVLQQITFGLVFTVALSTVLAKTIIVLLAFKSMKLGRTMRWLLASGASNYVIPICTLVQVVICGIWLGLSPPFIDVDTHSEPRHLLLLCDKGSVAAFYCVLGYLGSLALVSFSLSYLVRNLPDAFNEAKFLTFSMLVFCSIWVTFLPVYHGSQGKRMVALEIFSILASSAGLLVCIFAPKCYIILIRPDKNSLKYLKMRSSHIHPSVSD
ncbi:vomeronasal type-2 receptor 116-like [Erinaceus europaeus]|uniref:Vomeronasal type-2 receptor 116-like n=1 Tax=Erinaceus europaeus TaxID=9365 RepID=A0ABM3WNP8_ERIEU|nr:vomeronasal type-2 receptor 116-like [Erinaceus europaeus]